MQILNHSVSMEQYRIYGHTLTYHAVPVRVPGPGEISVHISSFAGRTLAFNCYRCTSVSELKIMIQSKEGILSEDQRLIFEGKQLQDDRTLTSYHIQDLSTLFLLTRLNGCVRESIAPPSLGTPFVDISGTLELCNLQTTYQYLPGRIDHIDTNVECRCECTPTYTVICHGNFGTLELAETAFLCPNRYQSHRVTPIPVEFIGCKYRFHGIKFSGAQYTSEWKEVSGGLY
ncbi:hypothetical protein BGZ88_001788 [Linnemannia elongata]|nr:hypothetical protein BGZ88_001788 [Linnemannia elongata]